MANGDIKITELPVGILVQGSLFITSEPEQGGGYISTKISATDIATLVASIVSYASLNTTSKTVIGAINEILSKAEGKFIVVQTLPVSDIDPFAIYLVPKQSPGQSDFYDEYIYTNNAWEKIGTTDIDLSNYYTKTQVDSLLSAKADTSSLATVATSGNYNDLTNKPTIPQIADNVIGNDSTYSSQKIISLMPTNEASGAIANFKTQLAAPLVDVNLQINAQQASGTPTPDNPLPITGFTGANIPHTGANLLDVSEGTIGLWIDSSGNETTALQGYVSEFIKTTGTTIKTNVFGQGDVSFFSCSICEYDKDKQFIRRDHHTTASLSSEISDTLSNTTAFVRFQIYLNGGMTQTALDNGDIMVSFDSATTYEAYNGNTYTINFVDGETPLTVYGGELDLLSGVLTVNKGGKIYTGANSENWFTEYEYNFYGDVVTGAKTGQTIQCSIASSSGTVYTGNLNAWISNSGRINITIPTITHTVEDFRQLLTDLNNNNTPMMIVYELATPIEIQLTPHEITAFVGANNIWHDANGDTIVKFKQDIENYVADQLAVQLANNSRSLSLSKSAPAESEEEIKEEIKEKESEENKR